MNSGSGMFSGDDSMRYPSARNAAYGGFPQYDDPSAMDEQEELAMSELVRRNLAAHISSIFETNKRLRESSGIDADLMKRLRQMNGEYEPEDYADIVAKGQPLVYINISAHKQRTLVAWLAEFFTDVEKSFYIKPTPMPELSDDVVAETTDRVMMDYIAQVIMTGEAPNPEAVFEHAAMLADNIHKEIVEESKSRSAKMERVLKDDMVENKWSQPMGRFMNLCSTYGTAGLRSPVLRIKKLPTYSVSKNGQVRVIDKDRIIRECEEISPWDMFPSSGATDCQDGDLCLRVRFSPKELRSVSALPCYYEDNVKMVLQAYGQSGLSLNVSSDATRETLEKKSNSEMEHGRIIEGVEYWGEASGEMLIGLGITRKPDNKPIEEDDWYEINAIIVGDLVIYCRLLDAAEERPLDIAKVFDVPGMFWGQGPLHVIDHIQRMCNATSRNLLVNMGFASGPQGAIDDINRLHPMDDGRARPNKMWAFTNPGNASQRPVSFWTIPTVARELMEIFQFYVRLADEITGIPAFANGTDVTSGAARTASGLNMLFNAASRGIKKIVANMDDVLKSCIQRLYWWHMRYNKDNSIKGDVVVEVCGTRQFVMREQLAQKHLELMRVINQDQRMMEMQSPEELARMMREIAVGFELDPDNLAPSSDELRFRMEQAKLQARQEMAAQQEMMAQQAQAQGGNPQMPQPSQEAQERTMLAGGQV